MGGLTQMPLLPWTWKMALMRAWLARGFFCPAGVAHMMPTGDAAQMDYAGLERGPAHDLGLGQGRPELVPGYLPRRAAALAPLWWA